MKAGGADGLPDGSGGLARSEQPEREPVKELMLKAPIRWIMEH